MDKLCSIENRLDKIEDVLGIENKSTDEAVCICNENEKEKNSFCNKSLHFEINEFHNELANIKSLFSSSEN